MINKKWKIGNKEIQVPIIPYCITKGLIDAVQGDVKNGLVFCGNRV